MNKQLEYGLLALTFSVHKLQREPRQFVELVCQRFIKRGGKDLVEGIFGSTKSMGEVDQAELLVERGQLSEAGSLLLERKGIKSRILREDIKEQRARWGMEVLSSRPLIPIDEELPRVYSLQTSSVPYTQSGYTIRSLHSMEAMAEAGVVIRAATRLGYPVVIGKRPYAKSEENNVFDFDRLLPKIFPRNFEDEVNLAVSLLQQKAERFCPHVLHTTTDSKNAQVVSRVAQRLNIPWVYEVRGEPEKTWVSKFPRELQAEVVTSERFNALREKETEAMNAASAVIALSNVSKEQIVQRGVARDKVVVIPNAVDSKYTDLKYNKSEIRVELGLPERRLVGTVSSIVDYEGIDTLLEAAVLEEGFDVVIVGDGAHLPALKRRALQLGVEGRTYFVGKVPSKEAWKWYAALDVFAVPRKDTEVCRTVTPLKPLMALALGVPVVGSDLPAINEVTGNNLITHVPEDPKSLVQAIERAGEASSVEKQALRSWAKSRTWEVNGQKFKDLFDGRFLANKT